MDLKSKLYDFSPRLVDCQRGVHAVLLSVLAFSLPGCEDDGKVKGEESTLGTTSETENGSFASQNSTSGSEGSTGSSNTGEQGPETGTTEGSASQGESQVPDSTDSSSEPDSSSSEGSGQEDTTKDQKPRPKVRVQVKPDTELCSLSNGMVTTFKEGFASKQKLQFDEASVETGRLYFQGRILNGAQITQFEAKVLDFQLSEQDSGAYSLIAGGEPGEFDDGTPFKFGIALTPGSKQDPPTFVIDDWQEIPATENYNTINITTSQASEVLGWNKEVAFGACAFPEESPDTFKFEFANGDRVEFVTKTRKLSDRRHYQRGLALQAKGDFRGIKLDVNRWDSLVYAAPNFVTVLRPPALAVRFPEEDGVCGLWMEPDLSVQRKAPYTAHVLNCEHEEIEQVDLAGWSIPVRFGGNGL